MNRQKIVQVISSFWNSVWVYPSFIVLVFITFVALGISGTSSGLQAALISGEDSDNSSLIFGKMRPIRSDEWNVTTPMIAGQAEENFPSVNPNIGDGQNMNLVLDVPTKDWSQVFRPQNWAFFILPFDNAFAYRWWFMLAALAISVYFLATLLLPGKRMVASLLSISVSASSFLHWWYVGSTLGSFALAIGIALAYTAFLRSRDSIAKKSILTIVLVYLLSAFGMLLYPPFQIPCLIALAAYMISISLYQHNKDKHPWKSFSRTLPWLISTGIATIAILGIFIYQNMSTLQAIQNTSYPGARVVESGGYSISHLLSGSLAMQFQSTERAPHYYAANAGAGATNQSEASSFIFVSLALLPFMLWLMRKKTQDYQIARLLFLPLIAVHLLFLSWLFIPGLDILGKISFLSSVPHNRLIIGLGLINTFTLMTLVFFLSSSKYRFKTSASLIYSVIIFGLMALIHLRLSLSSPDFISPAKAIVLAIPVSLVVFFILEKKFVISFAILAIFTLMGSALINPFYRGSSAARSNAVVNAIRSYPEDGKRWIIENSSLENVAIVAGKRSLTGVYVYPQINLWNRIDNGLSEEKYNRYAHVNFNIDRVLNKNNPTEFMDAGTDQLVIKTEACSKFVEDSNVGYILSSAEISPNDQACVSHIEAIQSGNGPVFYIHTLHF